MAKEYVLTSPAFVSDTRNADKLTSELLGFCRGIVADGVLNDGEIICLRNWLNNNPEAGGRFPARQITERLVKIFENNVIEESERLELFGVLRAIIGETSDTPERKSTTAVFDEPLPEIVFPSKTYCFTGTFACGKRDWCEGQTLSRGGVIHETITSTTNFLVVGIASSRAWVQSSFGRKIEKAMEFRAKYGIRIVPEEHWAKSLK